MATILRAAREHRARTILIGRRAIREARAARREGPVAVATSVLAHQVLATRQAQNGVSRMLAEQNIDAAGEALLNSTAFTTEVNRMLAMIEQTSNDLEFARLVSTMVVDAGNAAESVEIAVRQRVGWVRQVVTPCCKRCAVLAGRFYRWSDGFERHPNCRCTHIPTTEDQAAGLVTSPAELQEQGLISDLTNAEVEALANGADLGKIVNVRLRQAGLTASGRVLARRDRLTPEGVFAQADGDRDRAVELLRENGYILDRNPAAPSGSGGTPPRPPGTPPTTQQGGEEEPDWEARREALGFDFKGRSEPHEIEFVERFVRDRGETIEWIHNDPSRSTNDFYWPRMGVEVELKSGATEPAHITGRILKAAYKAMKNHQVVKDVFVVDLGHAVLTEAIREALRDYNFPDGQPRRMYRISRVWVLSEDGKHLEEISVRQ